jgi:hypothetical protein
VSILNNQESQSMTDAELRELVRDAIARHTSREAPSGEPVDKSWRAHFSHGQLPLARGGDGDGACLIEPSVRCNHCGYCLSFGH